MPDITCPVCGSVNASTRTFCWKCAADLHAPVPDATQPMPTPKVEVPLQPVLIGGGIALAALALIAILVVVLGGTPAATASPGDGASGAPTIAPASAGGGQSGGAASGGPPTFVAPTAVAPTAVAPTEPPPPTAAPPTVPEVTAVPAPRIVSFQGPETVDCSVPTYDGFITLTWTIDNAEGATMAIDGSGIYQTYPGAQRSERLPFSCGEVQHTYTLTTIGGAGKAATRTLTIVEDSGV
jgi:hypothetical protein